MKYVLVCAVLALGCGTDATIGLAGPPTGSFAHDGGVDAGPPDATISHASSGLPCDVAALLAAECTVCHSNPPQGGAGVPLLTLADLMAPANTTMNMAELALARMSAPASMPPAPSANASAAEIATMQRWITSGMPAGTMVCPTTSPFDTPVTCSSGTRWTDGANSSPLMHPGRACIGCHTTWRPNPPDPLGTMAGTVYRTAHEPDDCNGLASTSAAPITISVVGFDGVTTTVAANAVGNFFAITPIALPIESATVTYQGRTRVMASPQSSADCNSCHTEGGILGAPGRIMAP